MHPAALSEEELLKDVQIEQTRGSGPGGQHRNRVATEIRLTHQPTGVRGAAGERRQSKDNRRVALFRLRLNLALDCRAAPQSGAPTSPAEFCSSELWQGRVCAQKIACNSEHRDFPALLAEALDTLAYFEDDHKRAADALGISNSQFLKFIGKAPKALSDYRRRSKQSKA